MQGVPPWHTAEEMRAISNFAHWIEGGFIALLALVALLEALGRLHAGRQRYVWPLLILGAGAFLAAILILPVHGLGLWGAQLQFVWRDPQQRQHLFIAFALLAAGSAEYVRRARPAWDGTGLRFVWPAAVAGIGLSFLLHTQHGSGAAVATATRIHQGLAALLLSAGLLAAGDAGMGRRRRWLSVSWPMLLLVAAAMLIGYREPAGAYEGEHHTPNHPGAQP